MENLIRGNLASLAGIRACMAFLAAGRDAAVRAYRHQYGLFLALPVACGCLDAFARPWSGSVGFVIAAGFLEGRAARRLALQSLIFAAWSAYLAIAYSRPAPIDALRAFPEAASIRSQARGTLQNFPSQNPGGYAFILKTREGRLKVLARNPPFALEKGQRVAVIGKDSPPPAPTNPGQFDYAAYLRSQGIDGVFRADSLLLLNAPNRFHRATASLRSALQSGLTRTLPASQLPLAEALLLGSTDALDPETLEDFRAAGMLHILAISGQHIGILSLLLLQILSALRMPRKTAFVLTAAALTLYAPISGSSISVVRGVIMFWCLVPAALWERPCLTLNNLGLAATGCLLCMPYQILSLGFQLSFAATALLILYSRPMSAFMARRRIHNPLAAYGLSTVVMSAVIFAGVYPVLAGSVHQVAPSSIAGNLATVGLSSGLLVACCLALLAAPLPGAWAPGPCFGEAAGFFSECLRRTVHALAEMPGSNVSVAALPMPWCVFLILLVFALPFATRNGKGLVLLGLGLAAFSGRWAALELREVWRKPASVAFLDVGQGDAAVCLLPGAAVLVDAGPAGILSSRSDAGRNVILPFLRSRGVNRLDLVIVSHAHLDHYGGLAYLIPRISIGKVVYPGEESDARSWKEMQALLARHGIPLVAARRGQTLYRRGEMSLTVLAPERAYQFSGRNDNSLACLLRLPDRRFLFTGDMEVPAQEWLLEKDASALRAEVLKVPHHGSGRSNALAFLRAARPATAVISAGRANKFGHPGEAILGALRAFGAQVYLTACNGAVIYSRSGSREAWTTQLRGEPTPGSR